MTTAETATAGPSAWQRFRTWRRGRPFWGGLVAIVAGLEIYGTSQTSIGDMEIKIGPGGMAAYVIPLMLVVAGLLAWFTPAQRHFYGIVVPAVSIYALLEINFGGWLIGTILGMVGGALIFAWTESKAEPAADEAGDREPDGDAAADDDTDHTPRHAAFDEFFGEPDTAAVPRQGGPDDDREAAPAQEGGGTNGRMLAIAVVPLLLVLAGLVAVRAPQAAYAVPCEAQTTTAAVRPAKTASKATTPASPKAAGVLPSSSAAAAPAAAQAEAPAQASASPTPEAGLLGKIVGSIVNLLEPDPSASPSETPAASPQPSASTAAPQPQPSQSSAPAPTKKPTSKPAEEPSTDCPSASASPVPTAKQLKAAAGQPDVAAKPSRMTGSLVTMTNLEFVGVVDLPTADGPITVLKFTMDQAVTNDFELLTYARGNHTKDVVFKTKQLTVKDHVAFYTSRFQGNLLGVIKVDYTPANPPIIPPPGVPLPIPVFFTDPDIQLVWVTADVLTGTPNLTSTLA